jgi:hypothetical protein
MLHAGVTDNKQQAAQVRTAAAPVREGESRPHFAEADGGRLAAGGPSTPAACQRHTIHQAAAKVQSTYGNQAVLRMLNRPMNSFAPTLQRKCACDGSESDCAACAEKKEATLHRSIGNQAEPSGVPQIVHEVLRSSGQPLDAGTRTFMEPRFGYDFSGVRLHTDARAAESARAVNALAYTVGNHIVVGAGQYAPQTNSTKRLLAHELAHVVQQGNASTFQGFRISSPGDSLERQAALAEEAIISDRESPVLTEVGGVLQRQQCGDPLGPDPDCTKQKEDEKKKMEKEAEDKLDPKTKRVYRNCPDTCKTFLPVEVAPDVFITLCDDNIATGPAKMGDPKDMGCTPGRLGMVRLNSGDPAWQLPKAASKDCSVYKRCTPEEGRAKAADTSQVQFGYIQTIENVLSGGVYYKRDTAGNWVWAGNSWQCLKNVRDGEAGSTEPWYGKTSGSAGPKGFDECPLMSDTPWVLLPSGQNIKCIDNLYDRPDWQLRRLRIDGIFHVWLIAKVRNGPPVYIHNWTIKDWVVFELNDGADPCHSGGWQRIADEKTVVSKGPGQGAATPKLNGKVPAEMTPAEKDCSTPPSSDLKDQPCSKLKMETTKDEKKK